MPKNTKKAAIPSITTRAIDLFKISESPKPVTRTSEKNRKKPNAAKSTDAKKYNTAKGVALPGADNVGGTLPVPT